MDPMRGVVYGVILGSIVWGLLLFLAYWMVGLCN